MQIAITGQSARNKLRASFYRPSVSPPPRHENLLEGAGKTTIGARE